MITNEFEKFWNWLLSKADTGEYPLLTEWLSDNFYRYLAEFKPYGWELYIDDMYEKGYLSKEVYREELENG